MANAPCESESAAMEANPWGGGGGSEADSTIWGSDGGSEADSTIWESGGGSDADSTSPDAGYGVAWESTSSSTDTGSGSPFFGTASPASPLSQDVMWESEPLNSASLIRDADDGAPPPPFATQVSTGSVTAPPVGQGSARQPSQPQSRSTKKRRQVDEQQSSFDTSSLPTVSADGQLLGPGPVHRLDNMLIYSLLVDSKQSAHGLRPAALKASDLGAVFLERQSGLHGNLKPKRIMQGPAQQWKQSDISSMTQLKGITFGHDGKGEVWVKKMYGKVLPLKHAKAKAELPVSYHSYYLCWYSRGRDPAAPRSEQGKEADHIIGCVYHVHWNVPGAVPTSAQSKQVKEEDARQSSIPLDIRLSNASDPNWLRFQDDMGRVRGSVSLNKRGTTFFSKNGDFAEYHKRDPQEPAFVEGDLVGFGMHGLTRQTKGVPQLGVVTRRAIVTGTCPEPGEMDKYDTVAYIGMVPVKLRGKASTGQFVTPSGQADGTAVATSWRPRMSVGRVYVIGADPGDRCCTCMMKRQAVRLETIVVFNPADTVRAEHKSLSRRLAERAACVVAVLFLVVVALVCFRFLSGCASSEQECEAISLPNGQISGGCNGACGSSCTYQGCDAGYALVARDDLAAHADGHLSEMSKVEHLSINSNSAVQTRSCSEEDDTKVAPFRFNAQKRKYDGIEMSCVRTFCPAEVVNVQCGNGSAKNVSVSFPKTRWTSKPTVIACPDGFGGTASRTCGPSGWDDIHSRCYDLECPRIDIPLSGGPATMSYELQQRCYQSRAGTSVDRQTKLLCKKLFQHTVTLNATAAGVGRVTVDCPSPQYAGAISATCTPNSSRWQNWGGECLLQYCPAQWQLLAFSDNQTDQTNHNHSSSRSLMRTYAVRVHLPQQEAVSAVSAELPKDATGLSLSLSEMNAVVQASGSDLWSVVPCCGRLSRTGSCLDQNGSCGYIMSRCARNENGELGHQSWRSNGSWVSLSDNAVMQAECTSLSEAVAGVKLEQTSIDAAVLYRKFAHALRRQISPSVAKHWILPLNGSLSSVSVSMRGLHGGSGKSGSGWRPVVSVPRHGSSAAIDAGTPSGRQPRDPSSVYNRYYEFGRAAAGFADVSCRQLGWKRAAAVTNCQALYNMRFKFQLDNDDANEDWWAARRALDPETDVFLELCPEFRGNGPKARNSLSRTMCPRWLEVADEPLGQTPKWEAWLRVNALNNLTPENFSLAYDSFFRSMPYTENAGPNGKQVSPDFFNPLPETSSCSGAESDIRQCFWAQLQEMLRNRSVDSPQAMVRPCTWKIVVGCTNEHSNTSLVEARAAGTEKVPLPSAHEGIWVLGDQPYDDGLTLGVDENFWTPKIFTHFDGPYNCSTAMPVPELQIAQRAWSSSAKATNSAADWCWGKLLDVSKNAFGPVPRYCLKCVGPAGCVGRTTCGYGCEYCDVVPIELDTHGNPPHT